MTKMLDRAIEAVRRLPVGDQDDIARALLGMIEVIELDDIEPEHRAAVLEGLEQARRGEFATDKEVAEAFGRFDR